MCWNAEVSLITFLSSSAMCAYLWHRNSSNDQAIALWIFTFSLMQLFEFFMWINMKNHSIVSKLSLVFLLLQPLVLSLALLKLGAIYDNKYIRWLLWILVGISAIKVISAIIFAFYTDRNTKWLSEKGENCHLIWYYIKNRAKLPLLANLDHFAVPLLIALLCIKPASIGLFYALFGTITFYGSQFLYGMEMGSIWCWICNALGLFAILSKYIV